MSTRRWLSRAAITLAVLFVGTAAFVLPRIYEAKYRPPTPEPSAVDQVQPAPAFTPEQENAYVANTVTNAAYPGGVVDGKDGFYFLGDTQNANFSQAVGRRAYTPAELRQEGEALTAQQDYLKSRGISLAVLVSPAKWSVYQDKLPAWAQGMPMTHIFDQLREAYPDLPLADVRQDLRDARSMAETYSPMNSHWTDYGGSVAFKAMAKWLTDRAPSIGEVPVTEVSGVTTRPDYNNEMGALYGIAGTNPWTVPVYATSLPDYELTLSGGTPTQVPGDTQIDAANMPATTKNSAASNKSRVLVLGDSTTTALSPLLAAAFTETLMVRHYLDAPDLGPSVPQLVDDFKPDLVLYTMTERHFNLPLSDGPVWDGANRFSASANVLGQWPNQAATCSGEPGLSAQFSCRVDAGKAIAVKVQGTSEKPVDFQLQAGEHKVRLHFGQGSSTTYAVLPSQIAKNDLVMTAITPDVSMTITGVEIRAVT